jgi:hypothetical protein
MQYTYTVDNYEFLNWLGKEWLTDTVSNMVKVLCLSCSIEE